MSVPSSQDGQGKSASIPLGVTGCTRVPSASSWPPASRRWRRTATAAVPPFFGAIWSMIFWLVVSNSREAQTFQCSAAVLSDWAVCITPCRAMTRNFPMDFAMVDNGSKIDLVCKLVVFDHAHESHLMMTVNGCKLFHFDGLLTGGFASYTIFDATMDQQFSVPKVSSNDATRVLGHEQPSWDNLHRTIDLCSGFGGLSQGALAAGFEVSVAVDHNESMLGLYSKNSSAPTVLGDIGDKDVLHKVWSVSKGAKIISSGFSCQPFSRLGDGRSCEDARASCLPKTLSAAFYLQAKLIVLECVSPAGHDNFVKEEIEHFQNCTGYTCSQIDLKLDEVWPCRRHRAWWLLVAPDIGPIDMHSWTPLTNLGQVQNVIPSILLWSAEDEQDLMLDATEHAAFGIDANEHGRNMLNAKGVAPCALHAWGKPNCAHALVDAESFHCLQPDWRPKACMVA